MKKKREKKRGNERISIRRDLSLINFGRDADTLETQLMKNHAAVFGGQGAELRISGHGP